MKTLSIIYLMLLLTISCLDSHAAARSWSGAGAGGAGTDFNAPGNWTGAGALLSTDDLTMTISSTATVTLSADVTIGSLTIKNGTSNAGFVLNPVGYYFTIVGATSCDLTGGNGSTTIWLGAATFSGTIEFQGNVSLGPTNRTGTVGFSGNTTTSTLIFRGDLTLGIEAAIDPTNTTYNAIFDKNGTQTITWNNIDYFCRFNNINIGNTNNPTVNQVTGTIAPDNILGNMTINGTSILNLGTSIWNRDAAGGTLSLASGATLKLSGTSNFPLNFSTNTLSGLVNYYASAIQTINGTSGGKTYTNLTLSGTSAKTLGSNTTVNGILSIQETSTFALGGFTLTYGSAATLEYKGSASQTTSSAEFPTPFTPTGGVIIDNASGVILNANSTIRYLLTLTNGNVTTNANVLTLGDATDIGTLSGGSSSRYVIGNLQKYFDASNLSFTFPVGIATGYLSVDVSHSSITTAGYLTIKPTTGDHPNISSPASAIDATKSLNAYWTLTNDGTLAFTDYSATFNFVAGLVDGGATATSFIPQQYLTNYWEGLTIGSQNATSLQVTGVTTTSVFSCALGETISCSTPGTQASSVNVAPTCGFDVSWVRGNGSHVIVFMKQTGAGSAVPVDRTTYYADPILGSGSQIGASGWFCIYKGTGTAVTPTGLTDGITYTVHVIEYNCPGSDVKYNTSAASVAMASIGPLTGTRTVGTGEQYSTLTAAFADIDCQTIGSNFYLKLTINYVGTGETYPIVACHAAAVGNYKVIVYPDVTGISITSNNATGTLNLGGSKNVVFDGRVNTTGSTPDLIISNTNTGASYAVRFSDGAYGGTNYDATYDTIKYCNITSRYNAATGGTIIFGTSASGTSGNDYNVVTYNNIFNNDATALPVVAIYALGTTGKVNNNNTISNNKIYNFCKINGTSYGIYISSFNTTYTISGNSLYQTTTRTSTAASVCYPIYISNSSGNSFTISGNFIGGSGANCSGVWTINGAFSNRFIGIYALVSNSGISDIQGNIINKFDITTTAAASASIFTGIYISEGSINVGTTSNNTIGSISTNGEITLRYVGNTNASFITGIRLYNASASDVVNIGSSTNGNIIGGITLNLASGSQTGVVYISGIKYGFTAAVTNYFIANNIIGGNLNNSIQSNASIPTSMVGIIDATAGLGNVTISKNIITNLSNPSTSASSDLFGINVAYNSNTITNNIVSDFSSASTMVGFIALCGIYQSSTEANQIISNNEVFHMNNTTVGAIAVVTYGIAYFGGASGTNLISNNTVYSQILSATSTSAQICGLAVGSGTSTFQNNMITVGNGLPGTTNFKIYGIWDNIGTNTYYYNSVYVGGTGAGAGNFTAAFYSNNGTATRVLKNNIFYNARSGGTAKNYAIYVTSKTGITSNFNDIFNPVAAAANRCYDASGDRTFGQWQGDAPASDAQSYNVDPLFINPADAIYSDLHCQTTPVMSPMNAVATPISVTTDIDGQDRNATNPDIGADEFGTCLAPTSDASNLAFSNIASTSMTLTWDAPVAGDGAYRIVIAAVGAISFTPSNYNFYAANSAFGLGTDLGSGNYCVYNGSGNTFNITNLAASTNYCYKVFEYNCSGFQSVYYTGGTPLSGCQITPASAPEINIVQGVGIACGGTYNFGNVTVSTNLDIVFTIQNLGSSNLTFTTPLSGSGDYTIFAQPTSPVTAGSSTTFTVRFTPSVAGVRAGSVTITSNDGDEGSCIINFTGTGTNGGGCAGVRSLTCGETRINESTQNNGNTTTTWNCTEYSVWFFTLIFNMPGEDRVYSVSWPDATSGGVIRITLNNISYDVNELVGLHYMGTTCSNGTCNTVSSGDYFDPSDGLSIIGGTDFYEITVPAGIATYYFNIDGTSSDFTNLLTYDISVTCYNTGIKLDVTTEPQPDGDCGSSFDAANPNEGIYTQWNGVLAPSTYDASLGGTKTICENIYLENVGFEWLKTVNISVGSCWTNVTALNPNGTNNAQHTNGCGGGIRANKGNWAASYSGGIITWEFTPNPNCYPSTWGDGVVLQDTYNCALYTFCYTATIDATCTNPSGLISSLSIIDDGIGGTGGVTQSSTITTGGTWVLNTNCPLAGGRWSGITNTDWYTASNWCGGVPTAATNVTIIDGAPRYPDDFSGGGNPVCASLSIEANSSYSLPTGKTLTCNGNIVNNGVFILTGTASVALKGNWSNIGLFTANSSTVTFNSTTANQTIGGSSTFFNLTIDNQFAGGTLTLNGATTVSNVLTFTNGILNLNGYTLTVTNPIAGAITGGSVNRYINTSVLDRGFNSVLQWNIGALTTAHEFPFGISGSYLPFTYTQTAGDFGNISVSTYQAGTGATNATTLYANKPTTIANLDGAGGTGDPGDATYVLKRFWSITPSIPAGGTVTATFSYDQTEVPLDGEGANSDIAMQRYDAGTNKWQPALATQSSDATANTITVTGITGFSKWSAAKKSSPLPITLTKFLANCEDQYIKNSWSTFSETNNDAFLLEKSYDAENWEKIATIKGAGNSNSIKQYEYYDKTSKIGLIYYRLIQRDFNGKETIYQTTAVSCDSEKDFCNVLAYPNPAYHELTLLLNSLIPDEGRVFIYNDIGKCVYSHVISINEDITKLQIDMQKYSSGSYYIKCVFTKHNPVEIKFVHVGK